MKKILVRVAAGGIAAFTMFKLINVSWWWMIAIPIMIIVTVAVLFFWEAAVYDDAPIEDGEKAEKEIRPAPDEEYADGQFRGGGDDGDLPPAKLN